MWTILEGGTRIQRGHCCSHLMKTVSLPKFKTYRTTHPLHKEASFTIQLRGHWTTTHNSSKLPWELVPESRPFTSLRVTTYNRFDWGHRDIPWGPWGTQRKRNTSEQQRNGFLRTNAPLEDLQKLYGKRRHTSCRPSGDLPHRAEAMLGLFHTSFLPAPAPKLLRDDLKW